MRAFGLGCSGCGVSKYETIEQGARAHGLRIEPIVAALEQRARIRPRADDRRRRPAAAAPRARASSTRARRRSHVVPIMSGKGGVGKSLVTALLAVGLRRRNLRVGILDADITGPSIPKLFGLHEPLDHQADPLKRRRTESRSR